MMNLIAQKLHISGQLLIDLNLLHLVVCNLLCNLSELLKLGAILYGLVIELSEKSSQWVLLEFIIKLSHYVK